MSGINSGTVMKGSKKKAGLFLPPRSKTTMSFSATVWESRMKKWVELRRQQFWWQLQNVTNMRMFNLVYRSFHLTFGGGGYSQ